MIDLKQNTVLREMPNNLLKDKKVENLALSLQSTLNQMLEWAEKINYTMDLEQLDEAVLDHLLWEKHITWSEGLALINNRQQKINFIKNATKLHRLKGTPAAIELVCELLNVKTKLSEWFEYDGEPYHFKVEVMEVTNHGLSEETMIMLENLVMQYKNVRSHLEALNIYLTVLNKSYIGCTTLSGEIITVYPYSTSDLEIGGKYYLATGQATIDTTVIYPGGI